MSVEFTKEYTNVEGAGKKQFLKGWGPQSKFGATPLVQSSHLAGRQIVAVLNLGNCKCRCRSKSHLPRKPHNE